MKFLYRQNTILFLIFIISLSGKSQIINSDNQGISLKLSINSLHHMKCESLEGGTYSILTTGNDPWILTEAIKEQISSQTSVLSFEYFCPKGLDHLQIFICPPLNEDHSKMVRRIGMSEGWVSYYVDMGDMIYRWGKPGGFLRLDFGDQPGINLQIRNLQLRPMTAREKEIASTRDEKKMKEAEVEKHIKEYLVASYSSKITEVQVLKSSITIRGELSGKIPAILCESAPYLDVTEGGFETEIPVSKRLFNIKIDRFENRNGILYDRMLSRWVLLTKKKRELISNARYPDEISAVNDLPKEVPASRKGLGDFSTSRGHIKDLDELDITSATINICFTRFMHTRSGSNRIEHNYNGKSFYFNEKEVSALDSTFRTTSRRGIVTAAVLLVSKAEQCPDPEIGRLMEHPDLDPGGIYSMPKMTSPESVECYAAALDFLASRYNRPDKKYGRLNHWIMHNEVDAGWVWTNMGDKTALIFMDTYIKSMRMCYAIVRQYNPFSEVFISLTHHWAWTSHPKFYPSKDLLGILLDYTRAEGDFHWAMALHPYPESLYEPKTWLDKKVDFTFNTPLITFKNLEVLDAWIKLPEVLYNRKLKRTLWLSENGTNSRTYSDQDLKEQAAGFAYAWKKLEHLDGIDGFQWHSWFDNRGEGGLRLGLRRFRDDKEDPGGVKPVWFAYQAAGRNNEDQVFDNYKELIGIKDWDEINFIGEIKND